VLRLLHRLGYSFQANAKVNEGRQHPDRDAQFRYLTANSAVSALSPTLTHPSLLATS
jgi:Rhodopirellula transposase DDE domain